MNRAAKIGIVAAVAALAAAAFVARSLPATTPSPGQVAKKEGAAEAGKSLPRLVDLGATECIPCKMMAPILEELKKEYEGRLVVEFIDVRENPGAGQPYGIRLIPTQIFIDASGRELFRHEGFFSKEGILAKWRELGVDIGTE